MRTLVTTMLAACALFALGCDDNKKPDAKPAGTGAAAAPAKPAGTGTAKPAGTGGW